MENAMMDSNNCNWIHLLFRGDCDSASDEDHYITEFSDRGLVAFTVPILDFKFKRLDELAELLISHPVNGLIITSPRVVEALKRAMELLNQTTKEQLLQRINPELVFVVGEKSGRDCSAKLGIEYNRMSAKSGNSERLIEFIKTLHKDQMNLIYPKGSRSDNSIEDAFSNDTQTIIKPLVVYKTEPIENFGERIIEKLERLVSDETIKLIINMIFFSPSGVEGYMKTMHHTLDEQISSTKPNCQFKFRFSSIGKTTEAALLENKLQVFCVSERPNPSSLVESILKACSRGQ